MMLIQVLTLYFKLPVIHLITFFFVLYFDKSENQISTRNRINAFKDYIFKHLPTVDSDPSAMRYDDS